MRTPIWLGFCVLLEEEQMEEWFLWLEEQEEPIRKNKWKENRKEKKG